MPFMNAYSKDLRLKTLAAIDRGISRKVVSELFGISCPLSSAGSREGATPEASRR